MFCLVAGVDPVPRVPPPRVPGGAPGVRLRLRRLGGLRGRPAATPGGRGRLRVHVLRGHGGPEREHEPGPAAGSQGVCALHRVHEGKVLLAAEPNVLGLC